MNSTDKAQQTARGNAPVTPRKNDPNLNWAMYNPDKANPKLIQAPPPPKTKPSGIHVETWDEIQAAKGHTVPIRGYAVYTEPTLDVIEGVFLTKAELLKYADAHGTRADCVVLYNKQNPDGFVFLGWDEIE